MTWRVKYFLTGKGIRKGDPITPLLCKCVVDVFSRMLGLCPNFIPGVVVSLQYADHTLIFLQKDLEVDFNLKLILTALNR
jgi:hypothetical protein